MGDLTELAENYSQAAIGFIKDNAARILSFFTWPTSILISPNVLATGLLTLVYLEYLVNLTGRWVKLWKLLKHRNC